MLHKIIRFFLENKLVTFLLLLVLIVWGIISAPFNWELAGIRSQLTLLNLSPLEGSGSLPANYRCVEGSGTQLEFADGAFDVVFSNSVIEHLASWEQQRAFAKRYNCIVVLKGAHTSVAVPEGEIYFNSTGAEYKWSTGILKNP